MEKGTQVMFCDSSLNALLYWPSQVLQVSVDTNQHKSSSVFSLKALNITRTGVNGIVLKSQKLLKLWTSR